MTTITILPNKTEITVTQPDGTQQTRTVELALTPDQNSQTLYEYNLPEANSLHRATGLQSLFPGLRLQSSRDVDTMSPADFLRQYRQEPAQGDVLTVRSPGEEHQILKELAEAGLLSTFSNLSVLAHEDPMYENAQPLQTTLNWLQEQGFDHTDTNTQDPDWPLVEFTRNPLQNTVEALRQENETLHQQQLSRTQELEELQANHNQLQQRCRETDLRNQVLTNELIELSGQLDDLKAQLEAARSIAEKRDKAATALEQQASEAENTIQNLYEEKQVLQSQLDTANSELEKTGSALNKAREEAQQLKTSLTNAQEALQTAEQTAKARETELEACLGDQKQKIENLQSEKTNLHQAKQDALTDLDKVRQECRALQKQLEQTSQQNNQARAALEKARSETDELKGTLSERDNQLAKRDTELAELKHQLDLANRNSEHLQQQLNNQGSNQSALIALQERMEYLFGQNTLQLEQAANALGSHISETTQSTARELEAGLALQQQLGLDAPSLGKSGLPKSVALELSRELKTKPYDLIIELGNGDITDFIAQTLQAGVNSHRKAISNESKSTHYVEASDEDLPKRILSLEHNRSRFNERAAQLKTTGLAGYVNLQFAPLVPYPHKGNEHLFYDCAARLQHLAQLLEGRQAHILAIISESAGETASRTDMTVALPALLQYLSAHKLDVLVNASANQGLATNWQQLLEERGLEYTGPETFGTEPVQSLTVNP